MKLFPPPLNATLSLSIAVVIASSQRLEAAPGAVQWIDFSETPNGDFQAYSEHGATFFAIDGVLTSTAFGVTPNGTRGLYGYDGDNDPRAVTAFFNPPVVNVSIDLGDYNADADLLLLEAYDRNGVMIARQTEAISRTASRMFTLTVQGSAIHKILLGSEGQFPNSVFADNIRFIQIPEPSTMPPFMMAATWVAARRACRLTRR